MTAKWVVLGDRQMGRFPWLLTNSHPNKEFIMPIAGIRQCGAKCRTKNGGPCLQPAMKDSNRCRMHFGHARKLKTHGRLTIQAEEERRQQRDLLKEMRVISKQIEKVCCET